MMQSKTVPWFLAVVLTASAASAQELPTGFITEPIGGPWSSPVGMAFIDQYHLLVAERDGRVFLVTEGVNKNQILDLSAETLTNGDRGLLGIAVPPDFDVMTGGWLYLFMVVDPTGGADGDSLAFSRLIRVKTAFDAGGSLNEVQGMRETLLGSTWSTGITSCHLSHTIGTVRFLSDGSLVLTSGDNAHYDLTDNGGFDPACFNPGRTPIDQDVGAFRSQLDNSLCGKVLRIDAETGLGLSDNPFFTGNPDDFLSRVYARGLRNPFRFTLLPGSGPREALFIDDVGWNTWEELNLCLGGENFGWPCFEGRNPQPQYQAADPGSFCSGLAHTEPLIAWHHTTGGPAGFRGNCATGLCVYRGSRYPEIYRDRLFFSDYGRNWLRAASLDEHLAVGNILSFGKNMAGPVDLVSEPMSGDLVYASLGNPGIFRIRFVGSNHPPTAAASASPAFGGDPLMVTLNAETSSDPDVPDGSSLSYHWDLGDNGETADGPVVMHVYGGTTTFTARVTVTDAEGLSDSAEVLITPGNTPPVIIDLSAPASGSTYVSDEPIQLIASAEDAEDGGVKATWTLDLLHDHHVHPDWATATGLRATLTPDSHGPGDNHFRVRLRVEDSRGLAEERSLEIFDANSQPQAHLVELTDDTLRVGQSLSPVGHVDFALGTVLEKQTTLTWDWGDGSADVFAGARHHQDTQPTHVYRAPGSYKLHLVAEREARRSIAEATIQVAPLRPAVAIFAPLEVERWVPRAQQEEIVAALSSALASSASEVSAFPLGQGEQLASWMESLLGDSVGDVLVLLDYVPASIFAGEAEGSLLERWIARGNGVVWTGYTPLLEVLGDDGTIAQTPLAADTLFDSTAPYIVLGSGPQVPTPLGERVLPALTSYRSARALRYDQLGPAWHVSRLFADDGDQDSDALELEHSSRGFYAQFLCADDPTLPRPAVLSQYLASRLGKSRLSSVSAPARH